MRHLVDLYRCLLLVWRCRKLRYGSVSGYAKAALQSSELVGEMRQRYPGRRFFWSFATNHVIDSNQEYVALWTPARVGADEGGFDAALKGTPSS
jgi:hypothetical protein